MHHQQAKNATHFVRIENTKAISAGLEPAAFGRQPLEAPEANALPLRHDTLVLEYSPIVNICATLAFTHLRAAGDEAEERMEGSDIAADIDRVG